MDKRNWQGFSLLAALAIAACSQPVRMVENVDAQSTEAAVGADVSDVNTIDSAADDAGDASASAEGGDGQSTSEPTGSEPGPDAGPEGGGMDVVAIDAPVFDAVTDGPPAFEAPFEPDVMEMLRDGPLPDSCAHATGVDAGAVCTSSSDCRAGVETCLPTGCSGERRCVMAGRGCTDSRDCLTGYQQCMNHVCVATGADCGDTRACPNGYLCEGTPRRCADHRRACLNEDNPCPYNSICLPADGTTSYCVPVVVRCVTDAPCLNSSHCRDADGDGQTECVFDGACNLSASYCAATPNCEMGPVNAFLQCGAHGICSTTRPCPAGSDCIDAWGTGVGECHAHTDSCQVPANCPAGQLCYGSPAGKPLMLGCN